MEPLIILFIFLFVMIYWIRFFMLKSYLKKKYPIVFSWLTGGPYYQKSTFYFYPLYNVNRAFDLIYKKSSEFFYDYKDQTDLLNEYERLIKDRKYIFEKRLSYTTLAVSGVLMVYFLYSGITAGK